MFCPPATCLSLALFHVSIFFLTNINSVSKTCHSHNPWLVFCQFLINLPKNERKMGGQQSGMRANPNFLQEPITEQQLESGAGPAMVRVTCHVLWR